MLDVKYDTCTCKIYFDQMFYIISKICSNAAGNNQISQGNRYNIDHQKFPMVIEITPMQEKNVLIYELVSLPTIIDYSQ